MTETYWIIKKSRATDIVHTDRQCSYLNQGTGIREATETDDDSEE